MKRVYVCIDLKSFYASVECQERNLDPLDTNLVVADQSRTEKTICLAVSPSLKKYGIPGRARLFEVMEKIREINQARRKRNKNRNWTGKSVSEKVLKQDPTKELDLIIAPPRMKVYMEYSTKIYHTYLKFVAEEDIFAYSIDEVFCDITNYLKMYKATPRELLTKMIHTVYEETGITATGGIGENMYLAKVAMDIVAKHTEPNQFGVRIAELDEKSYRKFLWNHTPLTDFWRIGGKTAEHLAEKKIYTMGDIARVSLENEELLYKAFGINAEFLIDHAWGVEPCTIQDVKKYKPKVKSISSGQVLHKPYDYEHAKLIVKEMADNLILDLVEKELETDLIALQIGYDKESLAYYKGETMKDHYGRVVPKHAHSSLRLEEKTSSSKQLQQAFLTLYEKIVNKDLTIRRLNLAACNITKKGEGAKVKQLDLFSIEEEKEQEKKDQVKEDHLQKTLVELKKKYGKNSILKGMNLEEGGTAIERNRQVGGHKE